MSKTHYKVPGIDARSLGQTEFQYSHQAACGYVRDNVTTNGDLVDCKLCLRSDDMRHYRRIDDTFTDSKGCY